MQKPQDSDKVTFKQLLMLASFSLLAVWALMTQGLLQQQELWLYDRMLAVRSETLHRPPVTVIGISEADLTRLQSGSLPDQILSELLQAILRQHPDVIGLDLYRDIPVPPGGEQLANLLNAHPDIIMPQQYGDEYAEAIPPPPFLQRDDQAGCTDFPLDSDNRVRRGLIYLGNDPPCFSFAYLIAQRYLAKRRIQPTTAENNPDILRLGHTNRPRLEPNDGGYRDMDNQGYQILLDYRFPPHLLRRYSLTEALEGRLAEEDLHQKIVLIGSYATSGKDFFSIPAFPGEVQNQKTPGVDVHAIFIDQLLRLAVAESQYAPALPEWLEWLWTGCWAAAGVWLGSRFYPLPIFAVSLLLGGVLLAWIVMLIFLTGIWIPLLPATASWLVSATLATALVAHAEHRHKALLMSLFSRHVSSPIARTIWQQRNQFINGDRIMPQRMTATVLFSDLAGFTPIAETLEPEVFIGWLNDYIDAMTAVIERHEGVVIRFIGDAIMAGFGIPVPRCSREAVTADAERAAHCALALQEELIRLNKSWLARGLPVVGMRIGLNTGTLLAGSLNSRILSFPAAFVPGHHRERLNPVMTLLSRVPGFHLYIRRVSMGMLTSYSTMTTTGNGQCDSRDGGDGDFLCLVGWKTNPPKFNGSFPAIIPSGSRQRATSLASECKPRFAGVCGLQRRRDKYYLVWRHFGDGATLSRIFRLIAGKYYGNRHSQARPHRRSCPA